MKIKFLGTGASSGIPSPFCKCRVCENARKVLGKEVKMRAGVIVNDDLLIDFSPDIFTASLKFGVDLSAIKHLLITHTHEDHFNVADLCARRAGESINRKEGILNFYGNETVYGIFDGYLKKYPSDEVRKNTIFHEFAYNKTYDLGDYGITPFNSGHIDSEKCMMYAISENGKCYLHATDVAPFKEEVLNVMKENVFKFDAVTLDMTYGLIKTRYGGHLNFEQVLEEREKLIKIGAVDKNTKFFVTHIYHGVDKTHEELSAYTEKFGISVAYDGLEYEL